MDYVDERTREGVNHMKSESDEVPVEKPVIAAADAITQPRTVMVKVLHAIVANGTVRTPVVKRLKSKRRN